MDSFEISSDSYDPTIISKPKRSTAPTESADAQAPNRRRQVNTNTAYDSTAQRSAAKSSQSKSTAPKVDKKYGIFLGIVLLISSVYMLIVSISYFSHGAQDQSIVQNNSFSDIAASSESIGNTGGPLGAFLSNLLISRWLGIGSFILIAYFAMLGLSLVRMIKIKFWSLTFKSLISAITVSIFAGFATYGLTSYTYWGGEHGYQINNLLIETTGVWGAIGVNIILVSAVVLIFLSQIRHIYQIFARRIHNHNMRLQQERALAEERRRKAEERRRAQSIPTPVMDPRIEKKDAVPAPAPITAQSPVQATPAPEPKISIDDIAEHKPATPMSKSIDEIDTIPVVDMEPTFVDYTSPAQVIENEPEIADIAHTVIADSPARHETSDEVTMTVNAPTIDTIDENEISNDVYDPTAELSRFRFPPIDLLHERPAKGGTVDMSELEENKEKFTRMLNTYGIEISHIEATVGPTITLYEVIPAEGVRVNKIKNLEDDIALKLSALGIRIIAPMPGKGTIGIEVPNKESQTVSIRSILSSKTYQETTAELPMAMGATISNEVYLADLCKMPHLLVAGATGMGKSVGLNTIIASLLYKKHPAELKFVLVDPKMVEFSLYSKLERHYLAKLPDEEDAIITDMSKVVPTLNSLCVEMDNRYNLLKDAGVRDLKSYNEKFTARRLNPEKHRYLPYIVVIIDEFADLIMTSGKEVETPIARIAQKARAVGIHMILATQRPSTNVITGVIKANFPGRVAFRVTQMVDSRTIIDRPGANQLIGRGDMLFSRDGIIDRVQCAFIDTDEVTAICQHIADQIGYDQAYELPEYVPASAEGAVSGGNLTDRDPLFEGAAITIIESGVGSTSNLQRKYNIGYPRAGKIMDQLEAAGVVGPAQGGKPRQVLMDRLSFDRYLESH